MNKLITLFLVFFSVTITRAQGPPIYTDTPILLGLDGGGVRTFGKLISKENATVYVQPIAIPYNFGSKFQVGAMAMFINKNPKGMPSQSGIGDVAAFAKYQLFKKDGKAKTFRIITKLKQVFPTGKTDVTPAIGNDSWQSQLGLVSGYVTLKYGIYTEVAYNFTVNGLPDNLIYNVAFVYPLLPQKYPPNQLNLNIGLNGNFLTQINSNNLLLSGGIQWIMGKRVLFETGVQLPVVEDVPDSQQTNFIFTLGTRILIF
jgi:outer membrane putative beta-barrel porin/alpha-amylase